MLRYNLVVDTFPLLLLFEAEHHRGCCRAVTHTVPEAVTGDGLAPETGDAVGVARGMQ